MESLTGQAGKDATQFRNQAQAKLHASAALSDLSMKRYKQAAKHFLAITFDHLDFSSVLSGRDVAIYGSLCALASFDRTELQKSVIANTAFKQFLELEPQLNDVLRRFNGGEYEACLHLLADMKPNLLLDIYLAKHVPTLYSMIRKRGLVQYFSPYLSADMGRMAEAFTTSVTELEDELTRLILDGDIKARIDSQTKVVYAKDVDERTSAFERSLCVHRALLQHTNAVVLRAAMQRAKICVRGRRSGSQQAGGGGAGALGRGRRRAGASKGVVGALRGALAPNNRHNATAPNAPTQNALAANGVVEDNVEGDDVIDDHDDALSEGDELYEADALAEHSDDSANMN